MDPPPPPPHGNNAGNRSSGLPPGNYDIFIIPPHSSGSGFLYLPSLQPNRNSFLAGVACTLLSVAIWTVVFPVLREWFATIVASGGMGVVILLIGVGVAGWAWGKTQIEKGRHAGGGDGGASGAHTHANAGATGGPAPGATGGMPGTTGGMPGAAPGFTPGFTPGPKPTWQRANSGPGRTTGANDNGAAKSGWEKAREETRKKEEERKRAEDFKKRREEEEKERVKQREKDAREREIRERREKLAKEKENREQEEKAKEARERREREVREKEAKQRASATTSRPESPTKRHEQPTARTATEDDASASYSFRPYDKQSRKTTSTSSIYSESSYAPSHSTSRTTPPPSHRGPYRTADPDKIVLKAVYSFNNAFTKLPIAKLVAGVGPVTNGLILRITTEGLFIDDDMRGVPQREWDIKAWTLKLVEVWCPQFPSGASPGSVPPPAGRHGIFGGPKAAAAARLPSLEQTQAFLEGLLSSCRMGNHNGADDGACLQSADFKGLHVLRASLRDQEGKRYVFVLKEEEAWKVAVGLQRLRRGTQVRALGVSGMGANEAKGILESLGWL